jgi:hypothetical protein
MYQRLPFLQDGIAGIGGPCGLTGSFTGGFPEGCRPEDECPLMLWWRATATSGPG